MLLTQGLRVSGSLRFFLIFACAVIGSTPVYRAFGGDTKLSGDNVLFVTLDTTRADRLGCYGHKEAVTPTIDALAGRGVLFEQAFTTAPLTLPAHISLMTGRYPREHGVHNNGREGLGADFPTLAAVFKDKGYKTGAFLASFVLDSRFGLDRGFDAYNDDMGTTSLQTSPFDREQPANVVTDRALAWLDSVKSDRFFAWVHYYDPHDPYKPPDEFKGVGKDPYDAEMAFMDTQLKRLVQWLDAAKLTDRTLVVVVADHGEAFGEHGEVGHSVFLSDAVLHVPMIFAHPKVTKTGSRVSTIVESLDVFPTILELFGWDKPEFRLKRSFASALRGAELTDRPAFSESLYAFYTYGWAEQRSVTTRQWKYISSTRPQLFDRRTDLSERQGVLESQKDIAANLSEALKGHFASLTPGTSKAVELSATDTQKLRALGYVGGGAESKDFLTPGLLDPKDHRDTINQLKLGERLMRDKKPAEAIPLIELAASSSPDSLAIQAALGSAYLRLVERLEHANTPDIDPRFVAKAYSALEKVLKLDPKNEMALVAMGDVLMRRGDFEKALEHYKLVMERGGDAYSDIYGKVAQAYDRLGRVEQALPLYEKSLRLDPEIGEIHLDLGVIYMEQGRNSEALARFHDAVRLVPNNPDAHFNLGLTLLKIEQINDAIAEFEIALVLRPTFGKALINLGIALYKADRKGEANVKFLAAAGDPEYKAEANFNLGMALVKDDRKHDAVSFIERALKADPKYVPAIEELTRYYLQMKRPKEAMRVLRIGVENLPNDLRFINMLAKVLATSQSDSARNGSEAVKLATRACEMTNYAHPSVTGTLAAAYAESGDFAKAIEHATKAIDLAKAANQPDLAAALQAELDGYKQNKPLRNPDF